MSEQVASEQAGSEQAGSGLGSREIPLAMYAGVHVTEHTVIRHEVFADTQRVTVAFESGAGWSHVTLFLPRWQLLRLREVLDVVAGELESEVQVMIRRVQDGPGVTDPDA